MLSAVVAAPLDVTVTVETMIVDVASAQLAYKRPVIIWVGFIAIAGSYCNYISKRGHVLYIYKLTSSK